jgi:signal transduction histidine kinase
MRAHGGSVSVDSAPGEGSTFTLHLPVAGPGTATQKEKAKQISGG